MSELEWLKFELPSLADHKRPVFGVGDKAKKRAWTLNHYVFESAARMLHFDVKTGDSCEVLP